MLSISQKHQILEAFELLDYFQRQKVLNYIKDLLPVSRNDDQYRSLKREAMKEIRRGSAFKIFRTRRIVPGSTI